MRKQKKQEQIKRLAYWHLTHRRLQADLAAVEAEIQANAPIEEEVAGNAFAKVISGLKKDVQNERRRRTVQELTAQRKAAVEALAAFEDRRTKKELAFSEDDKRLKALMEKVLFKGEDGEVARLQFALAFAVSDGREYQRPKQSLKDASLFLFNDEERLGKAYSAFEENFAYIHKDVDMAEGLPKGWAGVLSALAASMMPFGVVGAAAILNKKRKQARLRKEVKKLSGFEANTFLAMQLTLIGLAKEIGEERRKNLVDQLLKQIGDLRADAEYEWLVEKMDAPECKRKLSVYDSCVQRLASLLGV